MKWLLLMLLSMGCIEASHLVFQDHDLGVRLSIPVGFREGWKVSNAALGLKTVSYQSCSSNESTYLLFVGSLSMDQITEENFEMNSFVLAKALPQLLTNKKSTALSDVLKEARIFTKEHQLSTVFQNISQTGEQQSYQKSFSHRTSLMGKISERSFFPPSFYFHPLIDSEPLAGKIYINHNGFILRAQELPPLFEGFFESPVIKKRIRLYSSVEGFENSLSLYADMHFFVHRDHFWMILSGISPFLEEEKEEEELSDFSSVIINSLELY